MANPTLVRDWLARLGMRCIPAREEEDLTIRLDGYIQGFADMPDGVFCKASLEAMARLFEFFPAYAKLRRGLEQWLKKNPLPSAVPLLPGAEDVMAALAASGLSAEDRCAVRLWIEHRQRRDLSDKQLMIRLMIIRKANNAGYHWLIGSGNNTGAAGLEAASIAVKQGWVEAGAGKDWKDADRVRASVKAALGLTTEPERQRALSFLRTYVVFNAPENAHLVPNGPSREKDEEEIRLATQKSTVPPAAMAQRQPEPPSPDALAEFREKHGREAGSLTPEQLRAAREANPSSKTLLTPAAPQPDAAPDASFPHREPPETPEAAQPPLEADFGACPKPEHTPRRPMPWDTRT